MAKLHDRAYKLLFSHREVVADLLRGFVDASWVGRADMESLEPVRGVHVAEGFQQRASDAVWRLRVGREWVFVYILLEFQSRVDRFMAVRMLAYLSLLYLGLIRSGQLHEGLLPPVFPVVLYNGGRRWRAPERLAPLVKKVEGLNRWRPDFGYLLIEENRFEEKSLRGFKNLAAAMFRLENCNRTSDAERVFHDLNQWLELDRPEDLSLMRAFTDWIQHVVLPARGLKLSGKASNLQELIEMFAEQKPDWSREWKEKGRRQGRREGRKEGIVKGRKEGIVEGRKEGLAQGRRQGQARALLLVLEARFGEVPGPIRERVAAAGRKKLDEWMARSVEAKQIEDVFGDS